jgi:hypothetical protein
MAIRQILAVTVPDDMEYPAPLIQQALENYLNEGDRWRDVKIECSLAQTIPDNGEPYRG